MDDTDRHLISLLRQDARLTVAALASKLGVSRGTVTNRLRKLEDEQVIVGYTLRLRPDAEPDQIRAWMGVLVEGNHYFPESSLNRDYVTFSNHRSGCAWKGQAHYYSLMVNGDMNENAVWYYPEPTEAAANIKGRVAFWKGVKVE